MPSMGSFAISRVKILIFIQKAFTITDFTIRGLLEGIADKTSGLKLFTIARDLLYLTSL